MKIGVIADIHGDIEALKLALDLLDRQGAEQIICAGDLVGKGPHGEAVIDLILSRSITSVAGNHDVDLEPGTYSEDTLSFLRALPQTISFSWESISVLLAHGTPWSDFVYLFPTSQQHVFKRVAREAQTDAVILGHTHVPLMACVQRTWIFNPGSVCGTFSSGTRTCGILKLPDCTFQVFDISTGNPVEVSQVQIVR
jgi:putative phosphoesterase